RSEYRSRDFLKLIQLYLNEGVWNGKQIISKEWIAKATSPKANAWEGMDYGYLMWLRSYAGVQCYAMAGNGGQKVMGIPELNAVLVITTTNYGNRKAHGYTDELVEQYIIPAMK
ncbi:MAG: serine hydrolase, partial [Bacteroidota bacterium]